jgi:hypothetical protein
MGSGLGKEECVYVCMKGGLDTDPLFEYVGIFIPWIILFEAVRGGGSFLVGERCRGEKLAD